MDPVATKQGFIGYLYSPVLMILIRVKGLWFAVFKSLLRLPYVDSAPHPSSSRVPAVVPALDVGPENDSANDRSKSPLEEKILL
jgi:hypothetical protein